MIRILVILVFSAIELSAASDIRPPVGIKSTVAEYGTKTANSITVEFFGDGITKPGLYHVPRNIDLGELIRLAGVSTSSNGRFTIFRVVDGYERSFGFHVSRDKKPSLPPFPLLDGDYVSAATNPH